MPSKLFITGSKCLPEVCLFNFKIRLSFKEIFPQAIPWANFQKKKTQLTHNFITQFIWIQHFSSSWESANRAQLRSKQAYSVNTG